MVSQHADAAVTRPPADADTATVQQPSTSQQEPEQRGESVVAADGSSSWLARRWVPVAIVVGFLAHVAWRVWLARDLVTPAAHADEDGYLIAARVLAGGPGGT